MLLGNCETHSFRKAVVQNRHIASRVLCRRRRLDAVFWRLMHRCERQCSASVPYGDCLFCTTETLENIVSQLPIKCRLFFLSAHHIFLPAGLHYVRRIPGNWTGHILLLLYMLPYSNSDRILHPAPDIPLSYEDSLPEFLLHK